MNGVSTYASAVSPRENSLDGGSAGYVRQQAVAASASRSLSLSLTTWEGDSVTLASSERSDLRFMTYDSSGKLRGGGEGSLSAR